MIRVLLTTRSKTYSRKNGRATTRTYYVLRWRDSNGKWRQETVGRSKVVTRAEAEHARGEKQSRLNAGSDLVDKPEHMTIAQFVDWHQRIIAGDVRPSTVQSYADAGIHLSRAIGDVVLEKLNQTHVGKLKEDLRQHMHGGAVNPERVNIAQPPRPLSQATINKIMRTARAMLNRAVQHKLLARNPFTNVRMTKVAQAEHRIFTEVEEAAMLQVVADDLWWSAFITLGIQTGLRRNEMLNLLWDDVDFSDRSLGVTNKRGGTFTVGGVVYPILPHRTKSCEQRLLPLTDDAIGLLQRMQVRAGGSRYVFLPLERLAALGQMKPTTGVVALMNNLLRRFKTIQRRAAATLGSEADEWRIGSIHDMRRTFATRAARSGVPMHVLKRLLGHQSMETTSRYYLDVSQSDFDAVRRAVNRSQSA